MFYEDMLYEQENQTWFVVEDEMSGCDVKLGIRDSDEGNFPDCVWIQEDGASPITIGPAHAIHIYEWLGHHLERLKARARALDEARRIVNEGGVHHGTQR